MDASAEEIMAGGGQATALEAPSPPTPPVLELVAEVVEGWDQPPAGVKVVKNPDPPPKFIPAP